MENNVEKVVDAVVTHHDKFKEKRKPKNPIKFNVSLDQEQKHAKALILENTVTVLTGAAGSGKTLVACQAGLDLLFNREVEKIIVARPVVTAKEDIGFLPGGLKDKLDPFIAPIYDNMYRLYNKEKIDKEFAEGRIEIIPFAFMRGRNFSNSFIILDEAQNTTPSSMLSALTRIGDNSKMIITGDTKQSDRGKINGLSDFLQRFSENERISVCYFDKKSIERHPVITDVLKMYGEEV